MIFFDTETTGLIKPGIDDPAQQPRIIEIAIVRTSEDGEELDHYTTLINPGVPLEPIITKITGLTDEQLAGAPTFAQVLPIIMDMFRTDKEQAAIAHNVEFDQWMLIFELRRVGWEHRFPYVRNWIDTVPLSGGKKLEKWGQEVLGENMPPQSHRALDDVRLLMACWESLR